MTYPFYEHMETREAEALTPLQAQLLLHFYCICEPHQHQGSQPGHEAIEWFLKLNVIKKNCSGDTDYYKTTLKGSAWVKAMLMTKQPRLVWVDEHGRGLEVEP